MNGQPITAPEQTYALVIAVEHYPDEATLDLPGLLAEAFEVTRWLIGERQIPATNVTLLASAKDVPPLPDDLKGARYDCRPGLVTPKAVKEALVGLRYKPEGLFFFYWTGHGIQTADRTRRPLCADYNDNNKSNLNGTSLQEYLYTKKYEHPRQQVFIFDTCATLFDEREYRESIDDFRFGGIDSPDLLCDQYLLFASPDWRPAEFEDGRSRLTRELLPILRAQLGWPPNWEEVIRKVEARFRELHDSGETAQRPVSLILKTPGGGGSRQVAVGPAEGLDSAESPVPRRDRLADYLKCVWDAHHAMIILGLPTLMENPSVSIDQLFVEPALATQRADPARDPKDWVGVVSLSDTVADRYRLVILGDPGTGKSTLVSWIASQLASDTPSPWQSRLNKAIPLPFVLRDLDIGRAITWDGLVEAFLAVSAHHLLSKEQLARVLNEGSAVLLLDGLDEIGDRVTRRRLRAAVQEGLRRYPRCRWLLTSRIAGYAEVPFHLTEEAEKVRQADRQATVEELLDVRYAVPFDDSRIEHFARNWYDIRERGMDQAPVVKRKTRELVKAVRRDGDTLRLARIPNLLTMMALMHPGKMALPHGKALLYDFIAEAYLESIDRSRHRLPSDPDTLRNKKQWLGRVAFEMKRSHPPIFEEEYAHLNAIFATQEAVLGWLRAAMEKSGKPLDPDDPAQFLDRLRKRSGLMMERAPDQFAFTHLSFQEYFAAVYLHESMTSAEWIVGERAALEAAKKSVETLRNRYKYAYSVVDNEPYAAQVAAGTTSESLRCYAAQTAWHATLVFLFELIADSTLFKAIVREAIFGPGWEFLDYNPDCIANRMALLARLAANPHVKWETEIETAAIDRCIAWEMEMDGGYYGGDENRLPFRILLNGEPEKVRARLERIVHSCATFPSTSGSVKLDLSETGVTDLEPLSALTDLNVLQLEKSAVVDLRPLAGLANLRELDVTQTRVTDITPVVGLTMLMLLGLSKTGVTDVRPLAGLTKLRYLSLGETKVTELDSLAGLTNLEYLDLRGTSVSDAEVELLQAKLPKLRINR
jgi:internalin A